MAPTTVAADHEFEARILTPPHQQCYNLHNNNNNYNNNHHHHHHHHHHNNNNSNHHPTTNTTTSSYNMPEDESLAPVPTTAQFLPICDLMFNLISMIAYFCDSTFNIIAFFALYNNTQTRIWAHLGFTCICFSWLICQSISLKWALKVQFEQYKRKREQQAELEQERFHQHLYHIHHNGHHNSNEWIPECNVNVRSSYYTAILFESVIHCLQCGILWRYIRLVIPVADLTTVKRDARDLCILRILHAFCQSAPLLLIQAYIIWSRPSPSLISNLSITSALLSLFSVCWALASFTKYVREKFLDRFVLTWLGIITQFLWRAGTVSSRVVALTIFATHYGIWVLVVLMLHWCSMFLWLLMPNNLLRDEENLKKSKKFMYAGITAWVYCFCYLNFEERNSKQKWFLYYILMFLENNLLLSVCVGFSSQITWYRNISTLTIYLGFISGIIFMFIYYKHFHVSVLDQEREFSGSVESVDSIVEHLSAAGKKIAGYKANPGGPCSIVGRQYSDNLPSTLISTGSQLNMGQANFKGSGLLCNNAPVGCVFKCKFNPAFTRQSRKKKKMPPGHIQSIRGFYGQVQNR